MCQVEHEITYAVISMLQGVQNNTARPRVIYTLYGVVEHSGTLRSGHYTAYIKVQSSTSHCLQFLQSQSPSQMSVDQLVAKLRSISKHCQHSSDSEPALMTGSASEGRWFHISDTAVSQVKLANVLHCQAYILFYERLS